VLIAGGGLIAAKDIDQKVGWAKAFSRRAHHLQAGCSSKALLVGTLRFAHPYERLPPVRRQFELRKIEPGRHGASNQRPVACACRGLPGLRGHDGLRHVACGEIRTENDAAPVAIGDLQRQRTPGVIVPDLDRVDAMPVRTLAARQQKIIAVETDRPVRIQCADRETSREMSAFPDAA